MEQEAEVHEERKSSYCCHVNKRLLPVKGYYFIFLAGVGSLMRFMSIYMMQLGLSTLESGIIYGIMPFVGFLVRPLFGALADKKRRHREVLMVCSILTGIFFLLLLWVPSNRKEASYTITTSILCNPQDSFIRDCESGETDSFCRHSLSQFSNSTNNTAFSCSVSCLLVGGVLNSGINGTQVCFTSDVSLPQSMESCLSVASDSMLNFDLVNASDVISQEVSRVHPGVNPLHCRDFDLKGMQYGDTQYWQMLCTQESTFKCHLDCQNVSLEPCKGTYTEFGGTFWLFFFIYLLGNITFSPIFSLADGIAYDCLEGKTNLWGHQRLWGTIGFALFGVTSTFIMDQISRREDDINYEIAFWIFLGFCTLSAVDAHFLKVSPDLRCQHVFTNVCQLLQQVEVAVFLAMIVYLGALDGVIETFLFWFLKELGSTQLTLGISMLFVCFAETFFLFFSGKIINLLGRMNCLYAAFIAHCLRLLFYSLLTNPWQVLPVEMLHGVTFGLLWAAASSQATLLAPPGMLATMQGVLGGLYFGFGKGLGSIVTGFMYKPLGGRWTFRLYSISTAVLLVLFFILNRLWLEPRHRALESKQAAKQGEIGQVDLSLLDAGQTENSLHSDREEIKTEL